MLNNSERLKQWRKNNPVKYAYANLRCHAKARGKVFTITLEYFEAFCIEHDYIALKGRNKNCASIDRRDNDKGYEPGNLRVLTVSENASKGSSTFYGWVDKNYENEAGW